MLAENSDVRISTYACIDVSDSVVNGTGGVFSINSRATNAGKHARFDKYGTHGSVGVYGKITLTECERQLHGYLPTEDSGGSISLLYT